MVRRSLELQHFAELFESHFGQLRERYDRLLESQGIEVMAVHAGQVKRQFLDDMEYPFRVNVQFKALCPAPDAANSWVLLRAGKKPTLVYFSTDDFWDQHQSIDNAFWLNMFHVELIDSPHDIEKHLPYDRSRTVYIGEHIEVAQALGISEVNPEPVLSYLHYHRVFKSPYEQACIEEANRVAIQGHEAAEAEFFHGGSEFDCWIAYMKATQQGPEQSPYPHIVAHNVHAATLHYRHKTTQRPLPQQQHSMLIDAGADCLGYASDISRTYAFQSGEFSELIQAVDRLTGALVEHIRPGRTYAALHEQTHRGIAQLLREFKLVDMDEEAMLELGVTRTFMPHGFGHMLGLQVHDAGGNMADPSGRAVPPPKLFANLKTTRKIEPHQVVTIEPGIYFIDSLLQAQVMGQHAKHFNWDAIDRLRKYGGVRIEDNILVTTSGAHNMTRSLGLN